MTESPFRRREDDNPGGASEQDRIHKRFSDLGGILQSLVIKVAVMEQRMDTFSAALLLKANTETLTSSVDSLKQDFKLVRNVVFGMIGLMIAAVFGAMVTGVLRPPS